MEKKNETAKHEMPNVHQPPEKDSKITSDPLCLNELEKALDPGHTQLIAPLEFNVSFAGLMPLIDQVYAELCDANDKTAQHIPLCAFSYYIILHLWGRIAAIRRHHGHETYEERELLFRFSYERYLVPEPIAQYFRGIGDIIDSTGVEYLVNLDILPTAEKHGKSSGWAGRISDKTHNVYESIPMPGVAVARMYADVAAGLNPDLAGHWQLPDTIRPMDGDSFIGGNPTVNLLGYAPAVAIRHEQVMFLRGFSFAQDIGKFVGPFALDAIFLGSIFMHLYMINSEGTFKMANAQDINHSRFGSKTLMCFTVKETEDPNTAPPTSYYADNTIAARCSVKQDERFSTLAKVFTYRIRKDTFPAGVNQWSCFHFNNYREVPDSWVKNRNELFDDVVLWNIARFGTSFTNAKRLRRHCVLDASIYKSCT